MGRPNVKSHPLESMGTQTGKHHMKKQVSVLLYLIAVTCAIFYLPKIFSSLGNSSDTTPDTLAADARMEEDTYFSLREVAAIQLGFILISYDLDEESGQCQTRFSNAACPNIQADPEQLKADQKLQQDELHRQILLLAPAADVDCSGSVSREEGARFRDLFEFGHLAAHCFGEGNPDLPKLARAAGLESEEAAKNLRDYRNIQTRSPDEIRTFFP